MRNYYKIEVIDYGNRRSRKVNTSRTLPTNRALAVHIIVDLRNRRHSYLTVVHTESMRGGSYSLFGHILRCLKEE